MAYHIVSSKAHNYAWIYLRPGHRLPDVRDIRQPISTACRRGFYG